MSFGLLALGFAAAVNVARARFSLPENEAGRARGAVVGLGAILVFAAVVALVTSAEELQGALDVTPGSWRIAAGIVLGVGGVRALALPRPGDDPVLPGLWAAVVPVAFPRLLTPELVVLAVAAGADEPTSKALGAAALALVLVVALGWIRRGPSVDLPLTWAARLLGASLVVVGVALVVDGIGNV